jgi:hypothetical protein
MTRQGDRPPLTFATAASPVPAVSQENPALFKMLDRLDNMVGESSTSRTGFITSLHFLQTRHHAGPVTRNPSVPPFTGGLSAWD